MQRNVKSCGLKLLSADPLGLGHTPSAASLDLDSPDFKPIRKSGALQPFASFPSIGLLQLTMAGSDTFLSRKLTPRPHKANDRLVQ